MSTYAIVKKQIIQLEKKAAELRKVESAKIIANIHRQMDEYGLTVADLGLGGQSKAAPEAKGRAKGRAKAATKAKGKTRAKVPPKYCDPKSGKTWNGVGKAPFWIAKGKREDYLIDKAATPVKPTAKAPAKKTAKPAAKPSAMKATTPAKKVALAPKGVIKKAPAKKAAVKKVVKKATAKAPTKPTPAPTPAAS